MAPEVGWPRKNDVHLAGVVVDLDHQCYVEQFDFHLLTSL